MTDETTTDRGDILVVDDTPANLGLLSSILTSAGYQVRPAPGGRMALRAAQTRPPDLVLLDINMPEMDGFEVCRRLKEDTRLESIPILFISALTDTDDKMKAFAAGGLDYITKPFQAEEVLARVSTHLQNRRYQVSLIEKSTSLEKALDELQATQDRLVQTEKMAALGILTAGIAHEINNPVNFIKTSITALSRDMEDVHRLIAGFSEFSHACGDNTLKERLTAIMTEVDYDLLVDELPRLVEHITLGVERTVEIINSLRIYARPDGGEKIPVKLRELIPTALVLLKNRYKDRVAVETNFADLPAVPAQPGRLLQVLNNVIANAIDAVTQDPQPATPTVTIHTRREKRDGLEYAAIRVADNGPGISDEAARKIFDPFFTTKEIGRGTGLGMSISYGIVRDHDGLIEVTRGAQGGTVLSIFLPTDREESR